MILFLGSGHNKFHFELVEYDPSIHSTSPLPKHQEEGGEGEKEDIKEEERGTQEVSEKLEEEKSIKKEEIEETDVVPLALGETERVLQKLPVGVPEIPVQVFYLSF